MMKKSLFTMAGGIVSLIAGSYFALAQAPVEQTGTKPPLSFFVTSVGLPGGANMHGLAGADTHCQDLARNATGDRTHIWHAYLSTREEAGQPAINARDRIGTGPWYNAAGVMIAENVDNLHSPNNNINKSTTLNEFGQLTPGDDAARDEGRDGTWAYMQAHPQSIRHEILTGTQADGRAFPPGQDHTCNNWTSELEGNAPLTGPSRFNTGPGAEVGKTDDSGPWNSQHVSNGCSHESLARGHGAALFYCFMVN